jgi:HemY protein
MRIVLALLVLGAAVIGGAFFAGHPGQVEITWQGWQIETSVGVLVAVTALLALIVSLLVLMIAGLRRLPSRLRRRRSERRRGAGEAALTRGLVALAAGDASRAQYHAGRADALLDGSPLALLLAGETATRQGDAVAARQAYAALLEKSDSEFLGLRGLIGQSLRDGDEAAAIGFAERARRLYPGSAWLATNLVELQARAGNWQEVYDIVAAAARRNALPAERGRHHRGVALHQLGLAAERRGDLRQAAAYAGQAKTLAPDLAAPYCQHARLLAGFKRRRAAARAIERGWRTTPHPELARCYVELRPEDTPAARAAALERLATCNPGAAESHFALAEAALAGHLWGEARRHLGRASADGASRRFCVLMARLEQEEAGDAAKAREWLDRAITAPADPCYVCSRCGDATLEWRPLCRQCGGFDTLAWQVAPLTRRPIDDAAAAPPLMLPPPELPRLSSGVRSG